MQEFLRFTMAASIGAMGDLAVGKTRPSHDRPGRATILGLIGAALGVDREDEEALRALEDGYGLLTGTSRGSSFIDFHSVQGPPPSSKGYPTRRAELTAALKKKINPLLSDREYITDLRCRVVLWERPGARWSLPDLQKSLRAPTFVLFFGRKNCPLKEPMNPEIIQAETPLAAALAPYPAEETLAGLQRRKPTESFVYATDRTEALRFGLKVARVEQRRDVLANPRSRLFSLRQEAVLA